MLTSPTSLTKIVVGKFLGSFFLYAVCCSIFLVFALIISFFTTPDWSVIICTTIGVLLFGGAMIAIDIFVSSLTESQIISAVAGLAIGLIVFFMDNIINYIPFDWLASIFESVNFLNYYTSFTYGILRLTDVVFFMSIIGLFIFLTVRVFEKRRWS